MKGGTGFLLVGFSSTLVIFQIDFLRIDANLKISFSSIKKTLLPFFNEPVDSSKSFPVAILEPDTLINFASKLFSPLPNNAFKSQ